MHGRKIRRPTMRSARAVRSGHGGIAGRDRATDGRRAARAQPGAPNDHERGRRRAMPGVRLIEKPEGIQQ
jgi:hypothetical protein